MKEHHGFDKLVEKRDDQCRYKIQERSVERKQYQLQKLERYQESKQSLLKEFERDVVKEKSLYLREKE